MKPNINLTSLLLLATTTPFSIASIAQDISTSVELEAVKVTATRQGMEVKELAHSVTVIDRQQIENQYQTASNLGEILAKTVPGMAPASKTLTNYNQSIRGRNLLVLIDGIPQNTNRNVSRDLMNIDVANIERIEVLRGGSAVYGSGAAGGVVNIVTRQNEHKATSTIGLKSALSELDSDGLSYRGEQYVANGDENFDYNFNLAWESTNSFFDADGDRIAPEPSQGDMSDTNSLSLAGKARWFTKKGTFTLSANHFDAEQDSDYASAPSVAALPAGSVKAQAIPGLQLDKQNRTRNTLLNLAWEMDKTQLGSLDAQVYYRDYHARFTPFDGRTISTWNSLAQSYLNSESMGSRLTFNTDLTKASRLRWGLDMNREKSEMPVTTFDGTAYDNSNGTVFIDTGDRVFVPPITQDNIGAFAQFESNLTNDLRWETGARYEYVSASFNDFTTLGQGNTIHGGDVSYDDFLFNTGLIYFINDSTELYGNFSQGFELPDIGLQLRYAANGFDITNSELKPIKTDNFEIGMRNDWGDTQTSIAVFYSTSDLGQTTIQNLSLALPRSEERIYGLELTMDHQLDDNWKLGGLLTWTEGKRYDESAGRWKALNGYRIAPLQVHAYTEYSPNNQWFHRLQVNYSGARDDAFEDKIGFGSNKVDAYTTVDYSARYQVAAHTLSLGIENLFNEDYYTVYGQLLRNGNNQSHVSASGTTVKASYQYQW
ncbi:TonB-dependent receptor [Marinomonas sp. BSi20584]|uniref:TonB-dependent receptor n=1 Tax=Marinomonas sp. BSi20584 TaxID=1594462 RepID=UPI000C1DE56F|nr:TonB-dependent receptor [Marinomonas sp. BSi20584]PJE53597.1 hypothetical protein TY87_19995 [Marinomonas sp. BSi20584]